MISALLRNLKDTSYQKVLKVCYDRGRGGGALHILIIVPMCHSEGSLCRAKLPRQESVFRRFSLDMGSKFRKSPILSCDNSFNGLICDTHMCYKFCTE